MGDEDFGALLEQVLEEEAADASCDPSADEPGGADGEAAGEAEEAAACGPAEPLADDELVAGHAFPVDEELVLGGPAPPVPTPAPVGDPFAQGDAIPLPGDVLPEVVSEDAPARSALVTISKLDGVPLFYARAGAPRPMSFSIAPAFLDHLTSTVKLVRRRAPKRFGELVRITTAGAYVDKPGFHGKGRAFDHDIWHFEHVEISPLRGDHAAASLARRQRYWALAALLRSRSAYVLHGHYDAAHRDHIHSDDGGAFAFTTSSEATVKLVQAVCNEIHRASPKLGIDGDYGPGSRRAVAAAMEALRLEGDITDVQTWRAFLRASGRLGFRLSLSS